MVVMPMSRLTFIRDPGVDWHYEQLGLQRRLEVPIKQPSGQVIPSLPFEPDELATVFHVQEVMRLTLAQLRRDIEATTPEGNDYPTVTSNKIQLRFAENSYSADVLWSNWSNAVNQAGGTIAGILQQLLGVRIREGGHWIPHFSPETIACGAWHMVDDVRPTSELIQNCRLENVWINPATGLRLVKQEGVASTDHTTDIRQLLGANQRFPNAESFLLWCLEHGTADVLPNDQGRQYFMRVPDDVGAFQSFPNGRGEDPPNAQWWTHQIDDEHVPHFVIGGGQFVFGILFKPPGGVDKYDRYWEPTFAHFVNTDTNEVILVDPSSLGLTLQYTNRQGELLDVKSSVVRNLRFHMQNEQLRALRILVARQGHLQLPDHQVQRLANLGFAGSSIDTPFSDMYYIRPASRTTPAGLVVGSPIEEEVKSTIFHLNWYGV
jgi:hypothetical protein